MKYSNFKLKTITSGGYIATIEVKRRLKWWSIFSTFIIEEKEIYKNEYTHWRYVNTEKILDINGLASTFIARYGNFSDFKKEGKLESYLKIVNE